MKKFFAIFLGLALVLGLASVASAALTVTGQFVVKEVYDITAGTYGDPGYSDSRFEVKLDGTYGNTSGDIKYRIQDKTATITALPATVGPFVVLRTANVRYKLSDSFTIGGVYDASGDVDFYTSPVYADYENDFLSNGYEIDDAKYPWMKMDVAVGDFKAMILNNMYKGEILQIRAGGTFNLDPITLGAAFMYWNEDWAIVPGITYAVSDEFSVAAEVFYENCGWTWYEVGFGAAYETDALEVSAALYYDVDASDIDFYDVAANFDVSDVLNIYGEYHSVDLITAGLTWKLDGSAGKTAINVEYAQAGAAADTLSTKVTIKF